MTNIPVRTLAALALTQATLVVAQGLPGDTGEPEARQLDNVTVTARRSIEQRFFATGSLVVVDRADIAQLGAFSVADVLRQLPGVQVTPNASGGIEIRMRGMERSATQLLIDGQRVGSGRTQLPLDQLPAEVIERIEVVRAPTAEFSGATGGTLNIVLRQASATRETIIRLTDNTVWGRHAGQAFFSKAGPLGELPRKDADADVATGQPWSYFVAVSSIGLLLGSDVERERGVNGTGVFASEAQGRFKRTDQTLLPRLQGRLGPSDQLALRGTLSRARFAGQYDSQGNGTDANGPYRLDTTETHRYERQYLQAAADWTHRFARSKLETTLALSRATDMVDRSGSTGTAPYAFLDDRSDRLRSLSAKLSGTADPLLWQLGALLDERRLDVENQSQAPSGTGQLDLGVVVRRQVLWGQNEWELPANTTLTAGLRAESLAISGSDAALLAERRTNLLQPSLHLRTPIGEQLQWRMNLSRVTRNPNIWDLVDRRIPSQGSNGLDNPDTAGNPALRPEVAWTLDTGLERRLAPQGQLGLNLFVRRLHDTIATVTTLDAGRWTERRGNVGRAIVWGLEVDAKTGLTWLGLGADWTLSANASLLQSRMLDGVDAGSRIPGQARYTASASIAKPVPRAGGLFGGATLTLTGPAQLNSAPASGRTAARTSLDVYLGALVRGWGYWRVGVFNIGDAPFERTRQFVDGAGNGVETRSRMTLTPRVYLTVGTQF
jgi:outer membrane receptor for ferrienterochelin and colicins